MASSQILNVLDDGEPRRSRLRRRVMLSARLATSSASYAVTLRDVSASGARVQGEVLPKVGTSVMLRRGAFSVYGALVWARNGLGGIAFEAPMDEERMMEQLKGLAPRVQPVAYRRPGLGRTGPTPRFSDGRGWLDEQSTR